MSGKQIDEVRPETSAETVARLMKQREEKEDFIHLGERHMSQAVAEFLLRNGMVKEGSIEVFFYAEVKDGKASFSAKVRIP